MPELELGARVSIEIGEIDLLARTVNCRYLASLGPGEARTAADQQETP
jgi:hypothetical protein